MIEYDVVHRSAEIVSIVFREHHYQMHRSERVQVFAYNFDCLSKKRLALDDVLRAKSSPYPILFTYLQRLVAEHGIPGLTMRPAVTRAIAPFEENYRNFSLSEDGITLFLSIDGAAFPYVLAYDALPASLERAVTIGAPVRPTSVASFPLRTPITAGNASTSRKKLALVLIGGPHPTVTENILDILYARQAPATFAPLGIRAAEYEPLLRRIAWEGHRLENAGWNHAPIPQRDLRDDYDAAVAFYDALDIETSLFMTPGLSDTAPAIRRIPVPVLTQMTLLDAATHADIGRSVQQIVQNIDQHAIVCLYEDEYALQALPRLIDALYDAGYEIGTLDAVLSSR